MYVMCVVYNASKTYLAIVIGDGDNVGMVTLITLITSISLVTLITLITLITPITLNNPNKLSFNNPNDSNNLQKVKSSRRDWMLDRHGRCQADPSYTGDDDDDDDDDDVTHPTQVVFHSYGVFHPRYVL
jgi:hypothetical protein